MASVIQCSVETKFPSAVFWQGLGGDVMVIHKQRNMSDRASHHPVGKVSIMCMLYTSTQLYIIYIYYINYIYIYHVYDIHILCIYIYIYSQYVELLCVYTHVQTYSYQPTTLYLQGCNLDMCFRSSDQAGDVSIRRGAPYRWISPRETMV